MALGERPAIPEALERELKRGVANGPPSHRDTVRMGRFGTESEALAAISRFSLGRSRYTVVEEIAPKPTWDFEDSWLDAVA